MLSRATVLAALTLASASCEPGGVPSRPASSAGSASAGEAPGLRAPIRPFVLELGETFATLCWATPERAPGKAVLRSHGSTLEHVEPEARTWHRARFEGLAPGTHYRYEIGAHRGTLRTALAGDAFEVAVFGHPGGTQDPAEYPRGLVASGLTALAPDFALCTGDIVYHSTIDAFRAEFLEPFAAFLASRPIYVAPSNHDCGWPWLRGIDYGSFRAVFSYDYAADAGGYYAFRYQNAKFIAVSYVQEETDFAAQMEWLKRELDTSRAEFNVVFLGGQSEHYYDKKAFFESLSRSRVDLVLGGDGGGVKQEWPSGVPFFFAGDGGSNPHPFYHVRFDRYRMRCSVVLSNGTMRPKVWSFYSSLPKTKVLDLDDRTVRTDTLVRAVAIDTASTDFSGLGFTVDWKHDVQAQFQVRWRLASPDPLGGERWYRLPYVLLTKNHKTAVRIAMPRLEPGRGEPYVLDELQLQLVPGKLDAAKYPIADAVSAIHLFKD